MKQGSMAFWGTVTTGVLAFFLASVAFAAEKPIDGASPVAKATGDKQGRPLKVFIMAGQSNMQGKAKVRTIERLNMTEDSKQMYKDMIGEDGKPKAVKDVYGVYFTSGMKGDSVQMGPLSPSYGEESNPEQNFGPEYTFAIYMQKQLNEPFLIIKTAWGGKDLIQQFRPPSAGDFEKEADRHGKKTGEFYRMMIGHVKEVLADPGRYHPAYDKAAGYEIAEFVWFQGYNDLITGYYQEHQVEGKIMYSQYSDLLAAFIRDVRKDLNSPKMAFVIGVVGFGGPIEDTKDKQYWFRKAQEAPAELPEFQGNVAAVRAEHCWDMALQRLIDKVDEATRKKVLADNPELATRPRALEIAIGKMTPTMESTALTPEELKLLQTGKSNAAFHYLGSAYAYGMAGKAFAEAMAKMVK